MVAPAMPVIMSQKKTTIGMLAIGINNQFKYPQYFSMVPAGPDGVKAFSEGYFQIAAAQNPKPKTVAIVSADAEFAKTAAAGARANAVKHGFRGGLRQELSAPDHRLHPGDARGAGCQSGRRLCRVVSAGYGRHRAGHQRDRLHAQDVRRHHDRPAGHAA